MNRLAAYGSDSEESDSEVSPVVVQTAAPRPQPLRTIPLPAKVVVPPPKEISEEPSLNLPAASSVDVGVRINADKEEDLDTTVLRKDWEIKLAEKEKKEFKKGKRKIDAFGGLSKTALNAAENVSDFPQKPVEKAPTASSSKSSLLSMLPPPKMSVFEKEKTSVLSFKPSSVKPVQKPEPKRRKLEEEDPLPSSSSDNDFFGLGSVAKKDLLDARKIPRSEVTLPSMFVVDEDIGPARPQPVQQDVNIQPSSDPKLKAISNEEARNLIYRQEVEQWGSSTVFANDAVMNIVDVNVDREIGSNVKETLLRNLDYRNAASFAVGRPEKPTAKTEGQKLAKMKHQITHLAGIAVAREEQLKEQWAQNKAAKVASKQKYGF
ncbi:hypothetical protein FO519_003928 [Halicephalobus sp. NKZ332]|nr:hypothetical protein FO519_003928 [Halicephalobus sp. NKZ332]